MIKFENYGVVGWEHAIRGMRNPMNSWDKSDSGWFNGYVDHNNITVQTFGEYDEYQIGPNDRKLMMNLAKSGSDHGKFRRMIVVYVDITAPLYWWKEFDTYKVGTVANSCSTMHKIHEKEFTLEDFSHEHLIQEPYFGIENPTNTGDYFDPYAVMALTVDMLNHCRSLYLLSHDKKYWWQMIQLLPSSYNQRRTIEMNYENLANMYKSRKNHKLDEWRALCDWIKTLPYSEIITLEEKE